MYKIKSQIILATRGPCIALRPGASFINKVPRTNLKSVVGHFLGYA